MRIGAAVDVGRLQVRTGDAGGSLVAELAAIVPSRSAVERRIKANRSTHARPIRAGPLWSSWK